MKNLTLTIFTILFCLTSNVVWSSDDWNEYVKVLKEFEKKNYTTAMRGFKSYASSGSKYAGNAAKNIANMYIFGKGVPKNYRLALKWNHLGAKGGDAGAMWNLGWAYSQGHGVPQDNVYAHMWYNICASLDGGGCKHNRDTVSGRMIPSQIAEAQKLARECVRKKYKGC